MFRPTQISIASFGVNVLVTQSLEESIRSTVQLFDDFDGVNLIDQGAQDGSLIKHPVPISSTLSVAAGFRTSVIKANDEGLLMSASRRSAMPGRDKPGHGQPTAQTRAAW